ncbi:MAG: DUF4429 domain-containing protein [Ethanoligenens sp.]
MAEPILTLKGVAGQLELHENKVVIKRKGALAKMTHGFTGDKEIMIRNITGVQLKLGGFALNGFIQFTIPGGNESRKGISSATQDENTVMFHKDQNKIAQAIKEKIEEIQESTSKPQMISQTVSPADEIRKLKGLLDDGIITQNEFDSKKSDLLSKI